LHALPRVYVTARSCPQTSGYLRHGRFDLKVKLLLLCFVIASSALLFYLVDAIDYLQAS
jgi:hypothetical protein